MSESIHEGPERRNYKNSELVEAISEAIRIQMASLTVPEDQHREHHEFIKSFIERERIKAERREEIKRKVSGWLIISVLGSIGTAVYHGVQYLRDHLK